MGPHNGAVFESSRSSVSAGSLDDGHLCDGSGLDETRVEGCESRPMPSRELQVDGVVNRNLMCACECHNRIQVGLGVGDDWELTQRAQAVSYPQRCEAAATLGGDEGISNLKMPKLGHERPSS